MTVFKKAERKQSKLRLALCGVSGSGKTYSAIKIAKGLGGKIALIDTENGSGSLYSDITEYDTVQLEPPFSPSRYIQLIKVAEKEGYDTIIIDSLSHAWFAEGGVLDIVEKATKASTSKNSYVSWKDATPEQNKLIEAIIRSNMHIIVTMRSKEAHDIVENNGKKSVIKMGLEPIQRKGMSYEFTVVIDISIDGHIASASKDRTGIFDGKCFLIDEKTGENLLDWLNTGKKIETIDEKINEWVTKINECISIEHLKHTFNSAKNADDNLKFIDSIVKAKNDKKNELEEKIKKTSMEMFGGIDGGINHASI